MPAKALPHNFRILLSPLPAGTADSDKKRRILLYYVPIRYFAPFCECIQTNLRADNSVSFYEEIIGVCLTYDVAVMQLAGPKIAK
jgi:hypothetical protein